VRDYRLAIRHNASSDDSRAVADSTLVKPMESTMHVSGRIIAAAAFSATLAASPAASPGAPAALSPAPGGWPVAWILATVVAALAGFLVGRGQGVAGSDWAGVGIGLLLILVAGAAFEYGRRSAAPVVVLDSALLRRLIEGAKE